MIGSWFSEKKQSPRSMFLTDIRFVISPQDVRKNYLIFTCNEQIIQTVRDQLEGYASRGVGRKIITEQESAIVTNGGPLSAQFPEYFYEVEIEKNVSNSNIKILGSDLALQSAVEALIYGRIFTSNSFRKLPKALYEYAKNIESDKVALPKMF